MIPHNSELVPIGPPTLRALRQLLEAHERARELGLDVWQFALEVAALRPTGITDTDVRWLVSKGYAEHAVERTEPRDKVRTFEHCSNLQIREHSCLALTAAGLTLARGHCNARPHPPTPAADAEGTVPVWDAEQHTLFLGQKLVKHYRSDAPHQEAILATFEANDWARCVSVVLPDDPGVSTKERLRNAVRNLNHAVKGYLRFHQEGNGSRVSWEPAAALPHRDPIATLDFAAAPRHSGRRAPSLRQPDVSSAAVGAK